MEKIKIMTVVGTRPEIIRLSAVINRFNNTESIEHVLVHTGQNYDYELNEVFFKEFKIAKLLLKFCNWKCNRNNWKYFD